MKSHRFSSPEIELKHSFQTFKKHFITFYNDVYGGSVEEYVEGLPDGKRRAIYDEMTGLLKNVKRLDKVIMKMKETNMKLSRLSDRQLRRLIRNADVRFGDVDKEFKRHVSSVLRKIQNIRLEIGQLRHESQSLGIPEFKKQLAKLDQSVESAYSALSRMDFEMKQ